MSLKLANQLLKEFSSFDDVSIKTFFGGFSISSKELMFGWINKKKFYLRGHQYYRTLFIDLDMEPLSLSFGVSPKLLDYYKVSSELFNNKQKLHEIVTMVIEYTRQDKHEQNRLKELRIKELPNMTLSLERLLYSVGIENLKAFRKVGYLESFYRIKNKKEQISINILFSLYGALNNHHVFLLSDSTKKEIELAYQSFLGGNDRKISCK